MKTKLLIAVALLSTTPALAPSLLRTEQTTSAAPLASISSHSQKPRVVRELPANPLWIIPLASLQQTRLKPLFSPTRRPPPPIAYAPPPQKAPAPVLRREPPQFVLVGTIVGRAEAVALVKDPTTQKVTSLRSGGEFEGWRLTSIEKRGVTVEKDLFRVSLQLPKLETQNFSPAAFPATATIQSRFARRR